MKTIQPRRVRITAFDFHPFLTPLADPDLFTDDLRFMAHAASYSAFFEQPALAVPGLAVRALRPKQLTGGFPRMVNHFWAAFRQTLPVGDAGRVFLPLVGTPTLHAATFRVNDATRGHARARVWLWPFGWASQVRVTLDGPMTLGTLRAAVAALHDGRPFEAQKMNSEPFGLTFFLRGLQRRLAAAVYAPNEVPTGQPSFTRSVVVSLEDFAEMPDRAKDEDYYDGLPSGELQRLHSALLGAEVPLPERGKGFTSTLFKGAGFGITYFDRPGNQEGWRTLLLLHPGSERGVDTGCLAENVALTSLLGQVLLALARLDPAMEPAGEAVAKPLVENAKAVLLRMRFKYTNPFALDMDNHAVIGGWRAAQQAPKPPP